jgi:hypothetical protein
LYEIKNKELNEIYIESDVRSIGLWEKIKRIKS